MAERENDLKQLVCSRAQALGARLIRVAPAARWAEHPIQPPAFWPQYIWPWVENVIVLGIPLYAPMMAASPSMVYQELYDTSNRVLDDMAYHLTGFLTAELGFRALYFPRDCYYSIETLLDRPAAAFSHVLAAYYAGMGTIGDSHNLLTKEFGPRLRMVSVLTDAPLAADEMLPHDLCLHCGKCRRACPSHCLTDTGGHPYEMDKAACTQYHVALKQARHWPCGRCALVCPVGEDLARYRGGPLITPAGAQHCGVYGS